MKRQSEEESEASVVEKVDVYSPIDEKGRILVGLALIGFVPKGAEVVGEFDEETNELKLYKEK